jgi:DNA-binding transcriptional regulator YhcF (GntR family)
MKPWFAMSRDIDQYEYFNDSVIIHVLVYILSKANFEDKRWNGIEVKAGQLVCSISTISFATTVTPMKIRRALERLEKAGTIERQTTNKYTIITICNYASYQQLPNKNNKQTTNKEQSNSKQITNKQQQLYNNTTVQLDNCTTESISNTPLTPQGGNSAQNSDLKNEGEGLNPPVEQPTAGGQKKKSSGQKRKGTGLSVEVFAAKAFPDLMRYDESAEDVLAWVSLREAKARTERAAELIRKKWKDEPLKMQLAVVRQSVEGGWRSIYPLKDQNQSGQKPGQKPAYQTAQVNFKKEADLIDMIKFSDDNASQRTYNLEMRAKLYLVRKGKDSQDPNLLKSVKEAHESGKLNLNALDLNQTNSNQ